MSGRTAAIGATVTAAAKAMLAATEDLQRRAPAMDWRLELGGPYIPPRESFASGWASIVGHGGIRPRSFRVEACISISLAADPGCLVVRADLWDRMEGSDYGEPVDLGTLTVRLDDGPETAIALARTIEGALLAYVEGRATMAMTAKNGRR